MLPTLFSFGGHRVATYGVLFALGCFAGLVLVVRLARVTGGDRRKSLNIACLTIVGATLGAVLPAGLLMLAGQPAGVLYGRWTQFGLAGALLAGCGGAFAMGVPMLQAADLCASAGALAHAIGRLGCFAAGCCFGSTLHAPWAVVYRDREALAISGTPLGLPLHPTQLYEAVTEALLAAVAYGMYRRSHRPGQVIGFYLVATSLARFAIEFVRAHAPADYLGSLTLAQWFAIALGLVGILLLEGPSVWARRRASL